MLDFYLSRFNFKYKQTWKTQHAEFDKSVNKFLDSFEQQGLSNPPIFFFIDPFGYTGFPMSTLKRILGYPLVELFINFMIYEINRRIGDPQFESTMIKLFGDDNYKKAIDISNPEDRCTFLINLYCYDLKNYAYAKFVMPFRVNTPDQIGRAKYFLIHVSKNIKALKLMKDRMAKASALPYEFEAIGVIGNQESLFENPEKIHLRDSIFKYVEHSHLRPLDYSTIEDWAYVNTSGYSKTIKRGLLELERLGQIEITRKPRQKKDTVNDGAIISLHG